jgi:hypothetical protein
MTFTPEAITALAELRRYAATYPTMGLSRALNTLDSAGTFAALDEQADTARAEGMLAEALQVLHNTWDRRDSHGRRVVVQPTEDSPALAEARANTGYAAVSRLGSLERVPGTDRLRPVRERVPHEHCFRSLHSDEVCYAAEGCQVTYGEQRGRVRAIDGIHLGSKTLDH